jgi:hypothetical protein
MQKFTKNKNITENEKLEEKTVRNIFGRNSAYRSIN